MSRMGLGIRTSPEYSRLLGGSYDWTGFLLLGIGIRAPKERIYRDTRGEIRLLVRNIWFDDTATQPINPL
jgi:hypothetical protein